MAFRSRVGAWGSLGQGLAAFVAFLSFAASPVLAAGPEIASLQVSGPWHAALVRADGGRVVFEMADPHGDDAGAGWLKYPRHQAFSPHAGLFDLQRFALLEEGDFLHFDLTFGAVTNPFSAPEGFYHQRVDIYLDTRPQEGSVEPFLPGPQVRFHPEYAWDIYLRVAPFGGTRLYTHHDRADSSGRSRGIKAGVQSDGRTIRVSVPRDLVGVPARSWRYYVLVGGYDHFGPDEWRDLRVEEAPWEFWNARAPAVEPRVVDLLAPRWGLATQGRQLAAFDPATGRLARLSPVGPGPGAGVWGLALAAAAAGLLLACKVMRAVGCRVALRRI